MNRKILAEFFTQLLAPHLNVLVIDAGVFSLSVQNKCYILKHNLSNSSAIIKINKVKSLEDLEYWVETWSDWLLRHG